MKRFLTVVAILFVSGCSTSGGAPVFGGFEPAGGSAVIFAPAPCDVPFLGPTAIGGIMLDFADYADSCAVLTQIQMCGTKANSTRILAMLLNGETGATSIDPAGPGTYSYVANPPTDAFMAATAAAAQVDVSCNYLPNSYLAMTGGTITITDVTDTQVTGSTNIHFKNGQVFEHPFDLPVCPLAIDLCPHLNGIGCTTHACVP